MDIAEENQAQQNKRHAIQAIMRDSSLTPQEKQRRIQEFMASGSQASETVSMSAPVVPVISPSTGGSRRDIQSRNQDDGITSSIRAPRRPPPPTPAPAPAPAVNSSATDNANVRPTGVGAVASTGVDPAARKGARVSSSMVQSAVDTLASEGNQAGNNDVGVGAVSSTGTDPAARKGDRVPSRVRASIEADTASVEPEAMSPPDVGAVASIGADPASRKGGRPSTRPSGRISAASSIIPGDAHSVGVASVSRNDDPAVRKAARAARTSNHGGVASTPIPGKSDGVHESRNLDAERVAKMEAPAALPPSYPQSEQMDDNDLVNKAHATVPHNSTPALMTPASTYTGTAIDERVTTQIQEEHLDQYDQSNDVVSPGEQPETYVGAGFVGPDVAGVEEGGIQAYVAGGDEELVVGATEVITEDALAAEEKKKQTRLLRMGAAILFVLLIFIVIPVALLVPDDDVEIVDPTDAPTGAPSASPTGALFADLLNALEPLYPDKESFEAAFSSYDTPQYRAADWAANDAPLGLAANDPRMISRYALATFYFATNGDDWESCGVQSTSCDAGREWLTAENECDWLAIVCEDPAGGDYTVREIFFPPIGITGNNIAGTLPFEIALLSSLSRIVLSKQALKGSIPETWSRLTNLETLIIGSNELTGTFPEFLFSPNTLLGTLYLSTNKITGPLPAFSSSALKGLRIDQNKFTGPIPPEFGNLGTLQELYLNDNTLTGEVPEELYNLASLRSLILGNNTGLSGTISESVANWQSMTQLRIVNTSISGPLPIGLFELSNLQVLELRGNSFSGPLSTDIARLTNVTHIQLSNNSFTGTIPDVFQGLQYLRILELHENFLTGSISAELCNRTGDSFFDINDLTADCLGTSPEVFCSCCSQCF